MSVLCSSIKLKTVSFSSRNRPSSPDHPSVLLEAIAQRQPQPKIITMSTLPRITRSEAENAQITAKARAQKMWRRKGGDESYTSKLVNPIDTTKYTAQYYLQVLVVILSIFNLKR